VLSEFLGRPFVFHRWNEHFGQLAHKSDYEKFDIKFLELIEKEREIITQICEEKYIHKEVTIEEVAVFKGNDYLPLKFASVSFYCQVSDTGSVG
jgi:hypothetical protein